MAKIEELRGSSQYTREVVRKINELIEVINQQQYEIDKLRSKNLIRG